MSSSHAIPGLRFPLAKGLEEGFLASAGVDVLVLFAKVSDICWFNSKVPTWLLSCSRSKGVFQYICTITSAATKSNIEIQRLSDRRIYQHWG